MATTTYGTPYVQSSDLVSAYPGTSSTLATRVDDISLKGNGVNAQTASYTLVLADGGKTVTMTNAGATTVTVPTNASVAFPTGVGIVLLNLGAGTMTVAGAGGVTVNGASLSCAQYEAVTLRKTDTNSWVAVKGGGLPKATYSSTTGSPTVTTVSGKTCVQFTGSGSVTVNTAGVCEVLVVGGGGPAGTYSTATYGGGGGAGGYIYTTQAYLPTGTYTVTIGAGGTAGGSNPTAGSPSGVGAANLPNLVALGGGQGGGTAGLSAGQNGGSGGGAGGNNTYAAGSALLSYQGNNGGGTSGVGGYGGGGGGSSGAGTAGTASVAGAGGAGTSNSITGSAVTYAVGGSATGASAGTANRGNGGTAAYGSTGTYNGGSGIVILLFG